MHPSILWLVRLGIDQKVFTREQALAVRAAVGEGAELLDFAQKLVDDGIVQNVDALENLANVAMTKGDRGAPLGDPFVPVEATKVPFAKVSSGGGSPEGGMGGGGGALGGASAAGAGHGGGKAQMESAASDPVPAGPMPKFPFDQVEGMDDAALAAAMRSLLRATGRYGASDLHLSTGARPFVRKNRALAYLSPDALGAQDALRLNTVLLDAKQKKYFLETKDFDYALALDQGDRYRVNLMFHKNGSAGAYRMVPAKTRTLADLGYTQHLDTMKKLLSYHNGLILITGPVGSGKTTTLASIVAYLNETREDHIITVEDPIEVVQEAKGCNVTQRQVGVHTKSFFTALKGALREDPDIIVIGELRDLETIEMAISASETGHLVIGTMHTSDAGTTLNRLLDVFPPAQQTQIRASVAECLRGVVCQRLLPAKEGGLVLACEILVSNPAIQNLIKEGKSAALRNTMETGVKEGMCLMDSVVFSLWQERKITSEVALLNITNNRVLRAKITT
jgi:twitching motility protein PilT